MGKKDGFIQYKRTLPQNQDAKKRLEHFNEFIKKGNDTLYNEQSARCMDCGVSFCNHACPLGNRIPEFNDAVYKGKWKKAYEVLISTNNFPEFTGRVCPAPCESSCVLAINSDPVAIEFLEKTIIEKAFENDWVEALHPDLNTSKKVAIIGSGPAGLACADELITKGHSVIVYEKDNRIGGLLRYGIPDFKLDKKILDRRINVLKNKGIIFEPNCNIGKNIDPSFLIKKFDAVALCIGSTVPRDLEIEGRALKGIYFAMDFLSRTNKQVSGDDVPVIDCKGKNILVIGGGDTGSDCIGTSNRLGAASVTQLEVLSKPPFERTKDNPWPQWPHIFKTSSSHEEGSDRRWCILAKRFLSDDGVTLSGVEIVNVKWDQDLNGKFKMTEIEGTSQIIKCEIALIAIGFKHPLLEGMFSNLDIALKSDKCIKTSNYKTSVAKLFSAGDARIGQSLVVQAIAEGRKLAVVINDFLTDIQDDKQEKSALNPFLL